MALKKVELLPAFNGIPGSGVGGTATLDVPRGPRYHSITLVVKDSNNADIGTIINEIRVNVNGKEQRVCSAAQLDELNAQNNVPAYNLLSGTTRYVAASSGGAVTTAASILAAARSIVTPAIASYSLFKDASNYTHITLFFNEKWRPGKVGEQFAWPTGNVSSFQIEVDIKTSAGTVTMTAEGEMDNAIVTLQGQQTQGAMPMGNIVKWYRTQMEVTGTTKNWTTFPYRKGVLLSVHFFDQYITNCQLKADSYVWRDVSQDNNLFRLAQNNMTGAASRFDLHLDYDDILEGGGLKLDGIQDLRFNLTLSDGTARNVPVLVQVYGEPD
jgi:hypothetical protein